MQSGKFTFIATFCFVVSFSAQSFALDAEQANRIGGKLGKTIHSAKVRVKGSSVHGSRATCVVNAPIEEVERVVFDYGRYNHFLPHLTKSKVLARRGKNAIAYFEAEIAKGAIPPRWAQMRLVLDKQSGATRVLTGKMTKGNLKIFHTKWYLTPMAKGTKTLVAFEMVVDPQLPSIFSGLVGGQVKKVTRRAVSRLRTRAAKSYQARLRRGEAQTIYVRGLVPSQSADFLNRSRQFLREREA